jgi:hypothetical protein
MLIALVIMGVWLTVFLLALALMAIAARADREQPDAAAPTVCPRSYADAAPSYLGDVERGTRT